MCKEFKQHFWRKNIIDYNAFNITVLVLLAWIQFIVYEFIVNNNSYTKLPLVLFFLYNKHINCLSKNKT